MISADDLIKFRLTPADLKARFDKPMHEMGPAEQKLVKRWADRAQAGRERNLQTYKLFLAIDQAWDENFAQTTPALLGMLKNLAETGGEEQALNVVREWRMTHLLTRDMDDKTGLPVGKEKLSLPALYTATVALARGYTVQRVSRIVNERMSIPFFKFDPAYTTKENQLLGEVTTQGIDEMTRSLGYTATFDQAVQGAAKYGCQLMFPKEEWFSLGDVQGGVVVPGKEGLRYHLPHPSRCYWDISHPVWTLNTGTGARFAGYWEITTVGSFLNDPYAWNSQRLRKSTKFLDSRFQSYLQTLGQCRMSYGSGFGPGTYVSALDREDAQNQPYYQISEADRPIWRTEHFEIINPRVDFGESDMPDVSLWVRVQLASDDVPTYVAILPDRAVTTWLYEPDDSRTVQEGMMLQVMPFQFHASNLATQSLVALEQNGANLTMYDKDIIDKPFVDKVLANRNGFMFRALNFLGFSGRALKHQGGDVSKVFHAHTFPKLPVGEYFAAIGQLMSLLERCTGVSAQEVGSYATHEQSAEENRLIHSATSQRYERIASWTDRAFEAWKDQLYSYWCHFSNAEVLASVSVDLAETAQALDMIAVSRDAKRMVIKAPKGKLRGSRWIAQRDGPNRVPQASLGNQMIQFVTQVLSSPVLAQSMPPQQLLMMLNSGLEAIGMPRTFRIPAPELATPDVRSYVQEQLAGLAEQTKGYVADQIKEMLAKLAGTAQVPAAPEAIPPAAPPAL